MFGAMKTSTVAHWRHVGDRHERELTPDSIGRSAPRSRRSPL